jgi:SAM-dependent methyltransferase
MQSDDYRRASYETWDAMALGWEARRVELDAFTAPVREWLVRELDPRPGETLLELAAGTGETGFEAAVVVGDAGRLISTDFTPAMVAAGRRRAEALGLTNVEHRVMDAEAIDLGDASVDGVLCRFGLMLMTSPAAALAEIRRVLRPRGRLVLAVWRGPLENPWASLAGGMLVGRGLLPAPEPDEPGMFALADEERLRDLLRDAGFETVRTADVATWWRFGDVTEYVQVTLDVGGRFQAAWNEAADDERAALLEDLHVAFAPFEVPGGYELPGVALAAVAS